MLLYCPQFCKTFAVSSLSLWSASNAAWGRRRSQPLVRTVGGRMLRLTRVARIQPSLPPPYCTLLPSSYPTLAVFVHAPQHRALLHTHGGCHSLTAGPLLPPAPGALPRHCSPGTGQSSFVRGHNVRNKTVCGFGRATLRGLGREAAWFQERPCVVCGEIARGFGRGHAWFEESKPRVKACFCIMDGVWTFKRLARRLSTRRGVQPVLTPLWRIAA